MKPDAFNIGVSRTVQQLDRLSKMLVCTSSPRRKGGVPDPRGGIRRVIDGQANFRQRHSLCTRGQRLGSYRLDRAGRPFKHSRNRSMPRKECAPVVMHLRRVPISKRGSCRTSRVGL